MRFELVRYVCVLCFDSRTYLCLPFGNHDRAERSRVLIVCEYLVIFKCIHEPVCVFRVCMCGTFGDEIIKTYRFTSRNAFLNAFTNGSIWWCRSTNGLERLTWYSDWSMGCTTTSFEDDRCEFINFTTSSLNCFRDSDETVHWSWRFYRTNVRPSECFSSYL